MKQRVVFVSQPGTWAGPPDPQGSIEIWTHEVARRLVARAAVRVYRPGCRRRTRRSLHEGVEYVATSSRYDRAISGLVSIRRKGRPSNLSVLHYLGYALRVSIGVLAFRPDVVHIQNQFPFVHVIRWFNRRVPIVLHMHGEWLSQLDAGVVGPALANVDQVVAASEHVAEGIRSAWPERAWECVTVPNGVDSSWLDTAAQPAPEPAVLFVGRLSPEKGLHVLLEAFEEIATAVPNASLTIVGPRAVMPRGHLVDLSDDPLVRDLARFYGSDPYPDVLEAMVPDRLANRVQFVSTMPHRQLTELYGRASVVVNPSLSESFGMSVVEAMAMGRPVVASAVGGMKEILADGVGGVLVPPGDAGRLASAVIELLQDPERRASMALTGRARVAARYTWDLVAQDVGIVYADLEDGARSKPVVGARFDRMIRRSEPMSLDAVGGPTLVIAPHPDDETLGCGGTIAALTGAGHRVGVVFLTDGGLSGSGNRAATVEERMAEARRACDVLGIKPADTWMFGLPDGGLRGHRQEASDRLSEVFDVFRPTRVFVPHANDGHPDHEAAFGITRYVVEESSDDIEMIEYAIWLWDNWPWTPQPLPWPPSRHRVKRSVRAWKKSARALRRNDLAGLDLSVDITTSAWKKRDALRAYGSQVPGLTEVGRGRFLRWFATSHELFRVTRP